MPAPANLGFETAGASPGLAASWTVTFVSTFEEIAGYGALNAPWEDFETEWNNAPVLFAFEDADLQRALYLDPVPPAARNAESFEVLWLSNEGFATELSSTEAAEYGAEAFEDFEGGWSNDVYLTAFDPGDFAGSPISETFNAGWANDTYLTSFTNPDLSAASFDGPAPEVFEDFEEVFPLRPYTADPGLDVLYSTAHGFANGQAFTFVGDGTLPSPFQQLTTYYARFVDTNFLAVGFTPAGDPIDIVSEGGGERFLQADPARYWTLKMTTL